MMLEVGTNRMEGRFKTTPKMGYIPLRVVSVDDDTDLTVANMKDGVPSTAVDVLLNHAEIVFKGSNAENLIFNLVLYLQAKGGPAELIAAGAGALGDVVATGTDLLYANSLTITQKWPNGIYETASDNVSKYIAKLVFDCLGYDKVYLVLTKNNVLSMGADIRFL